MYLLVITRFLGSRTRALYSLDLRTHSLFARLPCTHVIEATGLLVDSLFGYVSSFSFTAACHLVYSLCLRAILTLLWLRAISLFSLRSRFTP